MVFTRVCPTSPSLSDNSADTAKLVSDVFHTESPESPSSEWKHEDGFFRRGDLAGLREIKRRSSRHALSNRESFSSPHKASVSNPGTPAEPIPEKGLDPQLVLIEHSLNHIYSRLAHAESTNSSLTQKYSTLRDSLTKSHQVSRPVNTFPFPISIPSQP
jgi:hypothetical protein